MRLGGGPTAGVLPVAVVALAVLATAAAYDPTCANGIPSADFRICCAKECTRCTPELCSLLPGGADKCCPAIISAKELKCTTHDSPCVIPPGLQPEVAVGDPTCALGVINPIKTVCCDKVQCNGLCGGSTCSTLPGGSANCCAVGIKAQSRSCDTLLAPCTLTVATATPTTAVPTATPVTATPTTATPTTAKPTTAAPTTVSPTTAKPTTAKPTTAQPTAGQSAPDPTCLLGTKNLSNQVCCPVDTCNGQCAGSGCSQLPGGFDSCCLNGILATNTTCNTQGAPCIIVPTPKPTTAPPTVPPTQNLPADPTCANGIRNSSNQVCCPIDNCSGICGGSTCKNLPGGYDQCCLNGILATNVSCATRGAPCIIPVTPKPTTAKPTTAPTTAKPVTAAPTTATPTTAKPTTAAPTTARPTTATPTTAKPTTAAPTTAQPTTAKPTTAAPTTAAPTTLAPTAPTGDPTCSRGVMNTAKNACCSITACNGVCGGTGCQNLPGGYYNCCGAGVNSLGRSCSTNEAPCTMPVTAAPTTPPPTTTPVTATPTTAKPTTAAPTTAKPTTAAPTTAQPATATPTAPAPTNTTAPTTPKVTVPVTAADPYCKKGVVNLTGQVCCPTDWCNGVCGGTGCRQLPGGYDNCCLNGILAQNVSCSVQGGPCIIPPTPKPTSTVTMKPTIVADPYCASGTLSTDKSVCCPTRSCNGQCGGAGCELQPGGAAACCETGIKATLPYMLCTQYGPPCVIAPILPSTPAPTGGDPYCVEGILQYSASICCNPGCQYCGKAACVNDTLGASQCCGSVIAQNNQSCDTSQPPCNINTNRTIVIDPSMIHRETSIGILPTLDPGETLTARQNMYKMSFDSVLMYLPVQYLNWKWIKTYLDLKKDVQLVIEFVDSDSNLAQVAAGKYDAYLVMFGNDAAADGRQIHIRPLHEFNGDWYPWGAFRDGNTIDDFLAAFKHVVGVMRSTGANFQYQLAYAVQNANGDPTPLKYFYPGDQYVDQVCTSAYNLCGTRYAVSRPLPAIIGTWYYQVTSFTNKTLCMAEMSTTSYCGGKPEWLLQAWESLAYQFTKVVSINWFFENKVDTLGVDWNLNTPEDVAAWVDGYWEFEMVTAPLTRTRTLQVRHT